VWGQLGEETVSSHAEGFSWPAHRARIRTHGGWGGRKVNGRTPRGCPRRIPSARCWGRRGRGLAASPGAWRPPDRPPGGGSPAGVVGGGHPHHLPPGRGPPAVGWPGSGPSPSRCRARVGGGGGGGGWHGVSWTHRLQSGGDAMWHRLGISMARLPPPPVGTATGAAQTPPLIAH